MNTESVGHPNYAARISISKDTTYTAPSNGLVMALINQQDHNTAQLRINGYEYLNKPVGASYLETYFSWTVPLKTGESVNFHGGSNTVAWFFPYY